MSNDDSTMPWSTNLETDSVKVTRYRLGFRHALAVIILPIVFLIAGNSTVAVVYKSYAFVWDRLTASQTEGVDRPSARSGRVSAKAASRTGEEFWGNATSRGEAVVSKVMRTLEKAGRIEAEKELTRVFRKLNQKDPRQLRAFFEAYQNDPYAQQMGYIEAVVRVVTEGRLYNPNNIVACGECWCWRERPVNSNDATLTQ